MFAAAVNRIASAFSYDAIASKGRRKATRGTVHREDYHLHGSKRPALQENAADLCRNLSLASWMVRRHLDYVADFDFHARMESEPLNLEIEKLMSKDSRPYVADVAGRFGREKIFRLAEMRRVLDGDVGLIKLDSGQLQGLQGDLIANPDKIATRRNRSVG